MALKNNITGLSISDEILSTTMKTSTEKYSVIIHPTEQNEPQVEIPNISEEKKTEQPLQDERLLREIAELKDLLSEKTQKDEELTGRLETAIETMEKLPKSLQKEIAAGAALTFDKYLKTILEQRIGDARLELEAFKVEAEDVFKDERLKPRRRALLITLLIVDIIVTLGAAALIVLVKFGII